ncbi:unnamed protein product [Caenorhabditis bovis]|uniref:Uncharacterized protein n=1 Tax=Caenorhabditis bovis TaxID=2654633 RepID=A0A8S1F8E1_9PELO|nr:unnamed protein product [Caenorhabditis bovis]
MRHWLGIACIAALFSLVQCVSHAKIEAMQRVKMDDKQLVKFQQLHYGWYMQALSALLGSVGKQMYMKMKRSERRAFVACLDSIEKEYDVKAGANCLVKAFDGKLEEQYFSASMDPKLDFIDKQDALPMAKIDIKKIKKTKHKKKFLQKVAKSEAAKIINKIQKDKLKLVKRRKTMRRDLVSKHNVSKKGLEKLKKINNMRRRLKRNVLSLYSNKEAEDEAKRVDREDRGYYRPKNRDSMPFLLDSKKSPVKVMTNLIRKIVRANETEKSLESSYSSLKRLQDAVTESRAKNQYKNRMLDMVIGTKHPLRRRKSFTDRLRDITPDGLVDESVYGLVDSVSKHTNDVNANFLSPRFLPIMPDKFQTKKHLLSPDMFPLYKDDSENSVLPLPTVLENAGLHGKDRDSVLELVMDVSGVNTVVDDALNLVQGLRKQGLDKDMFDISSLLDGAYETIKRIMTKPQNLDMMNKKFSFMNKKQLELLYGENGIYNTSVTPLPFDINKVDAMTPEQKEESIRMTIREIARGNGATDFRGRRIKRQTITLLNGAYRIVFLNPTTLSPQAFSPTINQLSVLGPLTLSPQLFCPSILSPLLISPPVISPQVGNPLIFSPYVVGPNVLSAAVFNAYVFSPYVLSPNVINPYVLSPLILSPFVLCPDVLSPTILSGVVLSPSVLSPSVFTDSALAANVLSPTFLS